MLQNCCISRARKLFNLRHILRQFQLLVVVFGRKVHSGNVGDYCFGGR